MDNGDRVLNSYGVIELPMSMLVNPDGQVYQVIVETVSKDQFKAFIAEALNR